MRHFEEFPTIETPRLVLKKTALRGVEDGVMLAMIKSDYEKVKKYTVHKMVFSIL